MIRRCTVFVLVGLVLSNISIGELRSEPVELYVDPIVGAWRLNFARSTVDPTIVARVPVPPNQQETYRVLDDGRMQLVWTRSDANGSALSSTTVWPAGGGMNQDEFNRTSRVHMVTTLLEPGYLYVTHLDEDGRQSYFVKKMVHGDGRKMTQTIVASPQAGGRVGQHVLVWDRQ